jgi:hypothetical protein
VFLAQRRKEIGRDNMRGEGRGGKGRDGYNDARQDVYNNLRSWNCNTVSRHASSTFSRLIVRTPLKLLNHPHKPHSNWLSSHFTVEIFPPKFPEYCFIVADSCMPRERSRAFLWPTKRGTGGHLLLENWVT